MTTSSFGIWIAPEHRGCGYASEAVEAFVSHPIFGAAIRGAGCFEDNTACRKILERAAAFVRVTPIGRPVAVLPGPARHHLFPPSPPPSGGQRDSPIGQGADLRDYGRLLVPRLLRALFRKLRLDRQAVAEPQR